MPGCENVCYNEFMPISLERLWGSELICVFTPTVLFMCYAKYVMNMITDHDFTLKCFSFAQTNLKSKSADVDSSEVKSNSPAKRHTRHTFGGKKETTVYLGTGKSERMMWTGNIRRGFLLHLLCRIILEIGFFYILYRIAARSNGFDKGMSCNTCGQSTVSGYISSRVKAAYLSRLSFLANPILYFFLATKRLADTKAIPMHPRLL